MSKLKQWFNHRYPIYRLCVKPWCLRGQVYDHLCYKHNREYFDSEGR